LIDRPPGACARGIRAVDQGTPQDPVSFTHFNERGAGKSATGPWC
jgi:hypothetical protein